MRRVLVVAVLVVAAGWPAAAQAAKVDRTLIATITAVNPYAFGIDEELAGRATLPGFGRLSYTGTHRAGCDPDPYTPTCFRELVLTFTTRDGDTLRLAAVATTTGAEVPSGPLAWTVVEATGRFAGTTGAGTFAILEDAQSTEGPLVLAVSGALTRR